MENNINFFRIIRTPSSEVYGISDGKDDVIGRFDIHYANDGRIVAVVTIQINITQKEELQLVQKIDLDLVENSEINDDNFNITFFMGQIQICTARRKNNWLEILLLGYITFIVLLFN